MQWFAWLQIFLRSDVFILKIGLELNNELILLKLKKLAVCAVLNSFLLLDALKVT